MPQADLKEEIRALAEQARTVFEDSELTQDEKRQRIGELGIEARELRRHSWIEHDKEAKAAAESCVSSIGSYTIQLISGP